MYPEVSLTYELSFGTLIRSLFDYWLLLTKVPDHCLLYGVPSLRSTVTIYLSCIMMETQADGLTLRHCSTKLSLLRMLLMTQLLSSCWTVTYYKEYVTHYL